MLAGHMQSIKPGSLCSTLRLVASVLMNFHTLTQGADVTVIWETRAPYEAVLDSSAPSATVRGLRLRHASPSVANNYAVYMRGGSLRLEVCSACVHACTMP